MAYVVVVVFFLATTDWMKDMSLYQYLFQNHQQCTTPRCILRTSHNSTNFMSSNGLHTGLTICCLQHKKAHGDSGKFHLSLSGCCDYIYGLPLELEFRENHTSWLWCDDFLCFLILLKRQPIDSTNDHAHTQHLPVVSLIRKHEPTTVFTQSLLAATLGTSSQCVVAM